MGLMFIFGRSLFSKNERPILFYALFPRPSTEFFSFSRIATFAHSSRHHARSSSAFCRAQVVQ
jgi:hypothetical protein